MIQINIDKYQFISPARKAFLIMISSLLTSTIFILSFGDSIEQTSPILRSETKHSSTLGIRFSLFPSSIETPASLDTICGSKIFIRLSGNEIPTKLCRF
ncbi:putative LRR receptor serine/threonine-protein kinase [Trifolium repens]|nr:putative LRR receptor serine/threonine-protein kinase [Trifolium repens]